MKIQTKDGIHTLMVTDKIGAVCPFKPMILQQNSLGQMAQGSPACNSLCPHFDMRGDNEWFTPSCGNVNCEVRLEK